MTAMSGIRILAKAAELLVLVRAEIKNEMKARIE